MSSIITPFTFVHIADTHIKPDGAYSANLSAIIDEINKLSPAFVLHGGDQTEMGFTEHFSAYRKSIAPLRAPIYNISGNHEAKWSNWGRSGVSQFLDQQPYYSFDYNGIHFIGLDTSIWLAHHGTLDRSQLEWLKCDLDSTGHNRPIVLFYHHCPGYMANELGLLRLLRAYNVRLALVAHGHGYRTWKMNGIVFQMTEAGMADHPGYRILEVTPIEIRSYRKDIGSDRILDEIIPLRRVENPVMLSQPMQREHIEGPLRITAKLIGRSSFANVEYGVGENYQPITPGLEGTCDTTVDWTGTPGWHTICVRAVDEDGMQWIDSAQVRIGGNHREAWRVQVSGAVQRPITVADDRLYFGTWGGDVYCLDARMGDEVWRVNAGSDVISRIAVEGGRAYLGTAGGEVIALDAQTGAQVWSFKTGGPVQGSALVAEGMVFIGSGDHYFYALDICSGELKWKYKLNRMAQVTPVYLNGVIYFGAWDQYFHALRAGDGSELWRTQIGNSIYYAPANSNPATDGKRIFFAATFEHEGEPDILCLNSNTGNIIWSRRNPIGKFHCSFNSPCVAGDRLYIASLSGDLFCLSTIDGREIWSASTGQETYYNSPVFSNGKVYIGGITGGIFCFDAETGTSEWSYRAGGSYLFASPSVWENLVITPSTEGTVTALRTDLLIEARERKELGGVKEK